MTSSPNPPFPGFIGRDEDGDLDFRPAVDPEAIASDDEEPLDPDLDERGQSSADADQTAATQGVREGDVPHE
jgi:hypothetical protein